MGWSVPRTKDGKKNRERIERQREFHERLGTFSPKAYDVMEVVVAHRPNKAIVQTQDVSERAIETW